jgi:arsenate reductase
VSDRVYNVLFLCTGNSARSILAESLLNHWGRGRFRGFSAGSFPKGQVHPLTVDLLNRMNLPAENLRSKSWDEFAAPGASPIDFIFTVCDNAAGEVCPVWPGKPMTAHWGVADPAAVEGTDREKAAAFRKAFKELETRIKLLTNLPIDSLGSMTLKAKLREIGNSSIVLAVKACARQADELIFAGSADRAMITKVNTKTNG